jgi:hypothetical protein
MVDEIRVEREGAFELGNAGIMPALPEQGPSKSRVRQRQPRIELNRCLRALILWTGLKPFVRSKDRLNEMSDAQPAYRAVASGGSIGQRLRS